MTCYLYQMRKTVCLTCAREDSADRDGSRISTLACQGVVSLRSVVRTASSAQTVGSRPAYSTRSTGFLGLV